MSEGKRAVRGGEALAGLAKTWAECDGKPILMRIGHSSPPFVSRRDEGPESKMGVRKKLGRVFLEFYAISVVTSNRYCRTAAISPSPITFLMGLRQDCQVRGPGAHSASEKEPVSSEFPISPALVSLWLL